MEQQDQVQSLAESSKDSQSLAESSKDSQSLAESSKDSQSLAESSKDSQSLEGNWAQETTELSINEVSAPYEFRGGLYYCEGLEGAYSSLPLLRRAWASKIREEKIKEARAHASAIGKSDKSPAAKEKARKEYRKWQQTEIK